MRKNAKWLNRVAGIGCIICYRPATIHHIKLHCGTGKRADDKLSLPLCTDHHLFGGYGIAYHAGPKIWEETYGTQLELLEKVYHILGEPFPPKELDDLLTIGRKTH